MDGDLKKSETKTDLEETKTRTQEIAKLISEGRSHAANPSALRLPRFGGHRQPKPLLRILNSFVR